MNSSADSSSSHGSSSNLSREAIADVSYTIGFSLAVLVVLVIISYMSYKCNRSSAVSNLNLSSHGSSMYPSTRADDELVATTRGLDEATFVTYPTFPYLQAKPDKGDSIASGCSICLADYKDSDMLRLLPDCGHLFHLACIDPWLKLRSTCPICRSSPMPTPLASMVPLATQ